MEREKIKLNSQQHSDVCNEEYLEINDIEVPIKVVQRNYNGSSRHTEMHDIVFERLCDNKFFRVCYENSVKDSMGWDECNYSSSFEAIEVFPEKIETIIYK